MPCTALPLRSTLSVCVEEMLCVLSALAILRNLAARDDELWWRDGGEAGGGVSVGTGVML